MKVIFSKNRGNQQAACSLSISCREIVFIDKMLIEYNWNSLSIPRGQSISYNTEKFAKAKQKERFTEEYINKKDES